MHNKSQKKYLPPFDWHFLLCYDGPSRVAQRGYSARIECL